MFAITWFSNFNITRIVELTSPSVDLDSSNIAWHEQQNSASLLFSARHSPIFCPSLATSASRIAWVFGYYTNFARELISYTVKPRKTFILAYSKSNFLFITIAKFVSSELFRDQRTWQTLGNDNSTILKPIKQTVKHVDFSKILLSFNTKWQPIDNRYM